VTPAENCFQIFKVDSTMGFLVLLEGCRDKGGRKTSSSF